jgi:eukaryotic-like serine/threonine-protein kinase
MSTAIHAGEKLDHYRIDDVVAQTGMSTLFRATDELTGESVALKVPEPQLEADVIYFGRFQREQEIGQRLSHPGVIRVLPGNHRSRLYMVMEWVDGRPLRKILHEQGKLPQDRAIRIAVGVLQALEYIHSQGIVHRDLKPENIMVCANDSIKLIDFGIAAQSGARRLTFGKLSTIIGTPTYISPEQAKGKRGDARSDVYAAGVILYEMLTGQEPFTGDNPLAVMNDRLFNDPIPPREANPEISLELQEVIYRALERDPRNRYPHARGFISDLEHLDKVGVADRPELTNWKNRRSNRSSNFLILLIALASIPIIIALLLYAARGW